MADNSLSHSATGTVKLHTSLPSLHLASKCLMSWEHLPCVHKVQTQAPFPYWTFSRLSDAWWALLFVSEASTYKHEAMLYMGTSVLLPLSPRPPPPPRRCVLLWGCISIFLTIVFIEKIPSCILPPSFFKSKKDQIWSMRYSPPHNKMGSFAYKIH